MLTANDLRDERLLDERMEDLRRTANKVRRNRGTKAMSNWPEEIRAGALALVDDGVVPRKVALAVGVTERTIANWQKAPGSRAPVRELRVVADSPKQDGSEREGLDCNQSEPIRIRVGKGMEIVIPAYQFRAEWLLVLSQGVLS